MRSRSLILLTALIALIGGLLGPAGAAQAEPNMTASYAWLHVKTGSRPTGHIDITVWALETRPRVIQCVYDDYADSTGTYSRVRVEFLGGGVVNVPMLRNTTGSGTSVCRTDTLTRPGGNSIIGWDVIKGNCTAAGCVDADTDLIAPMPLFCSGPGCYDSVWQQNTRFVFGAATSPNACDHAPSLTNCESTWRYLQPSDRFLIDCQQKGQTTGGNPYWLQITYSTGPETQIGWIPSYYLNYPHDWVDQVPYCDY